VLVFSPNRYNQRGHLSRSQSLLTDENYRGASSGRQSEDLRKVSIKSDYDARFAGCVVKNLNVGGFVHLYLSGMHGIKSVLSQDHGSRCRQSLIKYDALHAASR
jgi:hypothetical protein